MVVYLHSHPSQDLVQDIRLDPQEPNFNIEKM